MIYQYCKDVLGVIKDWGFDYIKCFTFSIQNPKGIH